MALFDAKQFNPEVFRQYMDTIENPRVNRLISAGIFVPDPALVPVLPEGVGGNYMQENFYGRLENGDVNYDGDTDIVAGKLPTYKRGLVVIGRARAFEEKDFTPSLTGKNFMSAVAGQLVEYIDERHQDAMLLILGALFDKTNGVLKEKVVEKSLASLSVADIVDGLALQGDKSGNIVAVAMHSAVLSALKKANIVQAIKFLDADGIQRDLNIYQWDSRLVIEDDTVAPIETFSASADTEVKAGKVYYTRSGSAGHYTYTKVASPTGNPSTSSYYERTLTYPVFLLGRNAFTMQPLGVEVPLEMWRQPLTDGGKTFLISRERYILAPYGVGFKSNAMAGKAPTNAELGNAQSWELVQTGGDNSKSIELKTIPLACINFSISGI